MATPAVQTVFGRGAELEQIGRFLDEPDGDLGLLLEGVAGIGKSALWLAGIESGGERGYRVLACRPIATETAYSFAGLGDLLSPVVDDVLPVLPGPQRSALGGALALFHDEATDVSGHIVGLAVLSALRRLAVREPVLVAVDDVQWLDAASGAALLFAARRLEAEPVKLLLAARRDPAAEPSQVEAGLSDRLRPVQVGPLSSGVLHRIVIGRYERSLPRPLLERVSVASAGNPFHALEIARFLFDSEAGLRPGQPLPIPATVHDLLRARLLQLPRVTRAALEAVALLSEPTTTLLEGSGVAPESLDRAVAAGVIDLAGDRIRFTHPLFSDAVVSLIGPRRRGRLHGRLALLELDPEERARHLALASTAPDEATAAAIEAAAARAARRGAHAAAAELAELAAERTPRSEREARWRRSAEAGLRHGASGDFVRARHLLEPLVDEIPPGKQRAHVLMSLADIRWDDVPEMVSLGERALAEVGDDDVTRARIHAMLGNWCPGVDRKLAHHSAALEAAERAGDAELTVLAVVDLLGTQIAVGRLSPDLLDRALAFADDDGRLLPHAPHFENPSQALGYALVQLERFGEARVFFERARSDSLEQGAFPAAAFASMGLSEVNCRLGEWQTAARHVAELTELFEQLGLDGGSPFPVYPRARLAALVGDVDAARAAAHAGIATSEAAGMQGYRALHQGVLGFLELSLANISAAADHLQAVVLTLDEEGWRDPCGSARPDAVEALVGIGALDEAERVLRDLEDWSRPLHARVTGAACLRCRGLLAAARGDPGGAVSILAEAIDAYESVPAPFERGRTYLAAGRLQRRLKRRQAAHDSLGTALAIFETLGARLWVRQALDELAQLGGRRTQDGSLTTTEERIAMLVAQGRTNRQVADALFLSPKTVEWNLSKIYRKLSVRSRTELAAKVARSAGD
jgi:DNA-binding CsgD family transcriptional regulator